MNDTQTQRGLAMTSNLISRQQILSWYRASAGKNFMTPRVLKKRVDCKHTAVVELSSGTGMRGDSIWGVSCLFYDTEGNRIFPKKDMSKLFHNFKAAEEYFKTALKVD